MSARAEAAVKRPGFASGLSKANVASAAEKTRGALTSLNLHFVGIGLLVLLNIYLLIHMGYLWQSAHSQDADALAAQRVQLKTAQIAAAPLEGLDGKLELSTDEADGFYARRLPYAYSQVLTELGNLAKKENAKLTRVQYGYTPIVLDAAQEPSLTEIRMDASLTGDYRSLVTFINDLERDKTFFLISAVTLTGQQSGTVSLRVKVTTYLRPAHGSEKSEPLPAQDDDSSDEGKSAGSEALGGSAR
jgi:Tfp pilus assembly protein PilO